MRKIISITALFLLIIVGMQTLIVAKPSRFSNSNLTTINEESRDLKGFSKLEVSGSFEIRIIKSSSYGVKVEASEKDMKRILTSVEGDKLIIKLEKSAKNEYKNDKMLITIQTPVLNGLACSGAVEIKSDDTFDSEKFDLKTSGATEVRIGINAKLLTSKFSGATEVRLKGKVNTHALQMTGASELEAVELEVENYAIDSKGAADCNIFVTQELAVTGSGASSIKYKGSPSKVTKDVRGATEVSKM